MRTILLVAGILLLLAGLVWIGQGTGYFPYPSYSFMINETVWVWRGLTALVVGVIAILISRRIG